jgi:hypothetical protein
MSSSGSGAIVTMRSQSGGLNAVKLVKPIIATLPAVAMAMRNESRPNSDAFFLEVVSSLVAM